MKLNLKTNDCKALLEFYKKSDLTFLKALKSYIPDEDKKELEDIIYLNDNVGVGWGRGTTEQEQSYHKRKEALMNKYDELKLIYKINHCNF